MEKENLERTRLLRSQKLNSSGQFLYDKTNLINVLQGIENSPIENILSLDNSEQKGFLNKNCSSNCSPWEGNNPLVWGRSTDSRHSRVSSQRKRALLVAQANCVAFYKNSMSDLKNGNKSDIKSGHHRGLMSEEPIKFKLKAPIVIFCFKNP